MVFLIIIAVRLRGQQEVLQYSRRSSRVVGKSIAQVESIGKRGGGTQCNIISYLVIIFSA